MINPITPSKSAYFTRWMARIWSLLVLAIALLIVVIPRESLESPMPASEMIELGFYGLAVLGLLLAWRWELAGGLIALSGIIASEIAFRLFRGEWFVKLPLVFMIGAPAVLFILSWYIQVGRAVSPPESS